MGGGRGLKDMSPEWRGEREQMGGGGEGGYHNSLPRGLFDQSLEDNILCARGILVRDFDK